MFVPQNSPCISQLSLLLLTTDIDLQVACGLDRVVPQLITTCLQRIEENYLQHPNLYRTLNEYQGRALDLLGRFLKGSKVNLVSLENG